MIICQSAVATLWRGEPLVCFASWGAQTPLHACTGHLQPKVTPKSLSTNTFPASERGQEQLLLHVQLCPRVPQRALALHAGILAYKHVRGD